MEPSILSIIPIILTIGLAVWTRNVILSLFVGVLSGVLIIHGGHPIESIQSLFSDYVLTNMMDSYNAGICLLLVFIGGFVTLIEKSGGAEAFARSVAKFVNTRHKTQIAAWIGGILVFFSELGTPLIVGPIFTPIFEKMRISKEKLAWVLDTTASPVCVLIPFIGWGVYSMGLIQTEFDNLGITDVNDWTAFIKAIPFQIYPILCLIMVPLVAMSGREFGAMARAEKKAMKGVFSELGGEELDRKNMILNNNVSPLVALIPLAVLFVTLFGILIPLGFPTTPVPGGQFRIALITGYLFAAITMIILMKYYKVNTIKGGLGIYLKGCGKLFDCIMMLMLAWSLSTVGSELGTSAYIVGLAKDTIPAWSVPAIIFLVGAIMSFATGTSWGTFAIVMPIAIPMAYALGAPLYVTIAAVLSGGLFGDHCSPVSDTTILAATGAGCGLMEHMWTQLPYALIVAGISLVGFVIAGLVNNVIVTVLCAVALVAVYLLVSKAKGEKIENLTAEDVEKLDAELAV
ncbi:MAG: sodium:proton exchanger [Firmicutes bacterium]|nr:sodium:proton exchanger [Bacillota bacterium]